MRTTAEEKMLELVAIERQAPGGDPLAVLRLRGAQGIPSEVLMEALVEIRHALVRLQIRNIRVEIEDGAASD
jgi:hypothetical protein